MAIKIEKNWLNRLKENLNLVSEESLEMDLPSEEVRTALKKEMARSIRDNRAKNLVFRLSVV